MKEINDIDLEKCTIHQLVELRNNIQDRIDSYDDGFLYICKVRSYGRNWKVSVSNEYQLQELCDRYCGEDGIVDVYSNNPNLSIDNYGATRFIKSQADYDAWWAYQNLDRQISITEKELKEWENRDNVHFKDRPFFTPIYTREELEQMEEDLVNFNMSFTPPICYSRL